MDADAGRRFLVTISPSAAADGEGIGDELTEDDVLWTDDFNVAVPAKQAPKRKGGGGHRRCVSFQQGNSGILAALPEINYQSVLHRKPTSLPSPVKAIPAWVPRPERENATQSAPARKFQQSAPMKVPMLSIAMAKQRNSRFKEEYEEGLTGGDEEMMLPPHEIVARGWMQSSSSMLEGVGRTLKGRDLRQVRNAVFRQTGFLD
ncbi:unnamed protein product [Linum tenue]|uniref:Senescence regulator n=1 Tax=Linum tenue TaxID=586396 RepID=A0AAV0NVB2_9ROSI|nr:unnamed protein product [Linum tenue]